MSNSESRIPASASPVWEPNPARRLEAGFRRIAKTRMAGLPICHPKVRCQAVGFAPWKYFWLGVMITPWSINLILSPGEKEKWKSVPEGRRLHYRFPAGIFDFISVHDKDLGEYQMCSMLSPLDEIEDHSTAVSVAESILVELNKTESEEEEQGTPFAEVEAPKSDLSEVIQEKMEMPVTRRDLFRKPVNAAEKEFSGG